MKVIARVPINALVFFAVFHILWVTPTWWETLSRPSTSIEYGVELKQYNESLWNDCYKEPCNIINNVEKLNVISNYSLWQQTFRTRSNTHGIEPPRTYLFFKHIRKAGGTFFRVYLDEI
jgi:hypothetical protein